MTKLARLEQMNETANDLASTLSGIGDSIQELPDASDIEKLAEPANELHGALEGAKELWVNELPGVDDLKQLVEPANDLYGSINGVKELWTDGEMPDVDDLKEMADAADRLHRSMLAIKDLVEQMPDVEEVRYRQGIAKIVAEVLEGLGERAGEIKNRIDAVAKS